MKDFKVIFSFEYFQQLKKKSIIATTIVLAIFAALLTSAPTIYNFFSSKDSQPETETKLESETMPSEIFEGLGFYFSDPSLAQSLGLENELIYDDLSSLKADIKSEKLKAGFSIDSSNSFTTIYQDKGAYESYEYLLENLLRENHERSTILKYGMSLEQLESIKNFHVESKVEVMGRNNLNQLVMGYILMIGVYILILSYGNSIVSSIAREKDSRAMELLITSTKPKYLILGKVLASGAVALTQFAFIILVGLIFFLINKASYPEYIFEGLRGSFDLKIILVYFLFTFFGYILYLFIYASLGSTVSKVEDAGQITAPITILFVVAYFLATYAIQSPTSSVAKIGSYIPFSSLLVMPIRYSMTSLPIIELVISMAILIVFVFLFAGLSIKIYRYGSLNYGNKNSFFKVLKNLRKSKN